MTGSRSKDRKPNLEPDPAPKKGRGLTIEGYPIEGIPLHLPCPHGSHWRTAHVCCNPWIIQYEAPTIIVPKCIKELVDQLFEVHRKMDRSELKHKLIGLNVAFSMRGDLNVKAFRTYHGIPSQGYVVYSVKQKLKQEYIGLSGNEIKTLKSAGVEITNTFTEPQVAFTGDTMSDFITDSSNIDVLKATILVVEANHSA